ncbi:hypothetical protein CL648_00805 [bacterium]|nr:hypothetical protein [bacterium]
MTSYDIDDLRSELDSFAKPKKEKTYTPREERIIAGFEEIEAFFEENKRKPQHGKTNDIFEQLYAVRLEKILASVECKEILKGLDRLGLLESGADEPKIDDDVLVTELEELGEVDNDISKLTHVKSKKLRQVSDEIAQRTRCKDFSRFQDMFKQVQNQLKTGVRQARALTKKPSIKIKSTFILFGQIAFVADVGDRFTNPQNRIDARLRVVFDNGTESNMLMTSLERALYKDAASRQISDHQIGYLFSDQTDESDTQSGMIYVLRSKSDHPIIKEHRELLHKIGVTGGSIEARIANAKHDPTYLMDDVEVVATYKLSNINRIKLEKIIHKFFASARFSVTIKDRFGKSIEPREWYLVPLFIIDEAVERIRRGSILQASYDVQQVKIIE